jgi:hypothetical protein
MSLWGRTDQSITANSSTTAARTTGAPLGTSALVQKGGGANSHFGNTSPGSRASVEVAMFGNTTPGAFVPGKAVGVFGVDTTEVGVANGGLVSASLINGGSGYAANATVTVGGNTSVVTSNVAGGKVVNFVIANTGSFSQTPALVVAAPAAINIVGNTAGFSNTNDTFIVASANSRFSVGDRFFYGVPSGNTPIAPLAGNTYYYVSFANTTVLKLATAPNGANIDLTDARNAASPETHTITGDTATGAVTLGGGRVRGIAHAGWVLRTEGTGGRAGRVHYEVLVASSSITGDASDDAVLPDA